MKIQAQLVEAQPKEYTDKKTGAIDKSVKVTCIVPHDDPAHGYQIISGTLQPEDFVAGSGEKFPRPCSADVVLSQRVVNGYPATTLKLNKVICS